MFTYGFVRILRNGFTEMDEKEEGAAGGISQKPLQPLIRGSPFIIKGGPVSMRSPQMFIQRSHETPHCFFPVAEDIDELIHLNDLAFHIHPSVVIMDHNR